MRTSEIFTEQAEYLSVESFTEWSTNLHNENAIIKKLSQSGAKLITGPRGCGKTTLLLKVYNKLLSDPDSSTIPIYVNFKSSLKLEPLYRTNTNAAYWFNQWLLTKVLGGINSTLSYLNAPVITLLSNTSSIDKTINNLEMGRTDIEAGSETSISHLINIINVVLETLGKSRCVLLLDDAGHAFSSEQQHDFFEFFREVKTKNISPKAAVYPGVTSYSSSFHIGHDAEEIDVWMRPSSAGYMDFMHSLLKARLGDEIYQILIEQKHLVDLMCFASYGIPRALLNMIAEFNKNNNDDDVQLNIKLNSKSVLGAIKNNFDNTYRIYDSLRIKLPMYANFVAKGSEIYESCLKILKVFNKKGAISRQSSMIAIKRPISTEFSKVIGFFQYAGLISAQGISSRGGKGVYELFELHYSAIIDRNLFFSSRGISIENYCKAFNDRPNHHYPRHSEKSVLISTGSEEEFTLALPSCPNCNTPRISEESKFCSNCGVRLKNLSIFESIVSQGIENLPITKNRAKSIKQNSRITNIKDILIDTENRQLFKVPMIGPHWANKIRTYAEEFIA